MTRRGLLVALAVVAAVNLGVLVGVARNRAGEPESTVLLDERELVLVRRPADDSTIRLRWNIPREVWSGARPPTSLGAWIDQRKLDALGFDCSVPAGRQDAEAFYASSLPRKAIVVLELGGATWREHVTQPESASRLFPIDVGRDPQALRALYPDPSRYLFLQAVVRLNRDPGGAGTPPSLVGRIVEWLPDEVTVPRAGRAALAGLSPTNFGRHQGSPPRAEDWPSVAIVHDPPRYRVRMKVGHLLQPWIDEVSAAPTPGGVP
jgi:hypothetical protein